jgi:hypothetical protein
MTVFAVHWRWSAPSCIGAVRLTFGTRRSSVNLRFGKDQLRRGLDLSAPAPSAAPAIQAFCLILGRDAGEAAAYLRNGNGLLVRCDELGDDLGRFVSFMSAAEPVPRHENVAIVIGYRARR